MIKMGAAGGLKLDIVPASTSHESTVIFLHGAGEFLARTGHRYDVAMFHFYNQIRARTHTHT